MMSVEKPRPQGSQAIGYLIAGGVAGAVSRTVVAPFGRIRIEQLTADLTTSEGVRKQRGIVASLIHIGKQDGLKGFFKGNLSTVYRTLPYTSVQFLAYEKSKKWIAKYCPNGELSTSGRLTAGTLAGISSILVAYPLELFHSRIGLALNALNNEGLRGHFKGISPTLMASAPYVGLNFTFYETMKRLAPRKEGSRDPSLTTRLIIGAIAVALSRTITYPLDAVRRRLYTDALAGRPVLYKNTADTFVKIFKDGGLRGLFKDIVPNSARSMIVVPVMFVVYEAVKQQLGLSGGGGDL